MVSVTVEGGGRRRVQTVRRYRDGTLSGARRSVGRVRSAPNDDYAASRWSSLSSYLRPLFTLRGPRVQGIALSPIPTE